MVMHIVNVSTLLKGLLCSRTAFAAQARGSQALSALSMVVFLLFRTSLPLSLPGSLPCLSTNIPHCTVVPAAASLPLSTAKIDLEVSGSQSLYLFFLRSNPFPLLCHFEGRATRTEKGFSSSTVPFEVKRFKPVYRHRIRAKCEASVHREVELGPREGLVCVENCARVVSKVSSIRSLSNGFRLNI